MKVLFCSTSLHSSNGYSRVGYALLNYLAKKKDIEVTHWAFQNFPGNPMHAVARKYPANIQVYDAWANEEKTPGNMGFGFGQFKDFVDMNKPEVIFIYNDMVVVSNLLEQLKKCEYKGFKVVVYMDQVYLTQRKEFIKRLNEEADFVVCFTSYWEEIAKKQGLSKPTDFLQHGFDPMQNYPVPRRLARMHFGLKQEDFIVINTTRNVPRKRWDLCLIAWSEFVSRHQGEPVKLLIAAHPTQGSWNMIELYEHELRERGMTLEEGMKHIILIDNPQQLTDEDLNTLYNAADVGINTCQGAGFELTTHEHGGIGVPQIATYTGGIRDFLDRDCGTPIMPVMTGYSDMMGDGAPGKYEVCNYNDIADALERYYADEELRKSHGDNMRKKVLTNYRWDDIGEKLYGIFLRVGGREKPSEDSNKVSLDDIQNLESNLVIKDDTEPKQKLTPKEYQQKKKDDVKSRLQTKLAAKKSRRTKISVAEDSDSDDEIPIEKLMKMKSKIDKLINSKSP